MGDERARVEHNLCQSSGRFLSISVTNNGVEVKTYNIKQHLLGKPSAGLFTQYILEQANKYSLASIFISNIHGK